MHLGKKLFATIFSIVVYQQTFKKIFHSISLILDFETLMFQHLYYVKIKEVPVKEQSARKSQKKNKTESGMAEF